MLFKAIVSLLIFCLDDLFIDVSSMLKSPTIIVLLSFSPFWSVNICCIYFGAHMLGAYIYQPIFTIVGASDIVENKTNPAFV